MKYYSFNDISKLRDNNKIIIIRKNIIYDVTEFINKHPGGKKSILKYQYFDNQINYKFHSKKGKDIWKKFKIGYLNTNQNFCTIF
jgi:cytochrome b involved in lipid metabolism